MRLEKKNRKKFMIVSWKTLQWKWICKTWYV